MQNTDYVVGVDVGTSGVKALAFSSHGKLLGMKKQHYEVLPSDRGYIEHDPEMILRMTEAVLVSLLSEMDRTPAAIGFCTFMHSIMPVDRQMRPLGNLQLWNDNRSAAATRLLRSDPAADEIYRRTGTPAHPMSPLTKIRQMRDSEIDVFRKASHFVGIKEYLLYKLTGRLVLDYSTASATGLFDSEKKEWCDSALAWCGISKNSLSGIIEPDETVRCTLKELKGITIVPGLSDGIAANLGSANVDNTEFTLTLGTSAALRFTGPAKKTDPEGVLFSYCLDDRLFVTGGASNNCFNVLDRLAGELNSSIDILDEPDFAAAVATTAGIARIHGPAPAEPLYYLPWMFGERAPVQLYEPLNRFINLQPGDRPVRQMKSAVECILFNLKHIAEKLEYLNGRRFDRLHISGGLSRFSMVRDLTAGIFNLPMVEHETGESSALGTAFFTAYKMGLVPDFSEISLWNPEVKTHYPDKEGAGIFEKAYRNFRKVSGEFLKT
ncbi:MAG TPA: FGGY family carbohydrate kinase [Bacteroidales bacterium]|nr:FGGY family carbohydrate kinase [Bacteroidales bacterium]